MTDDQSPSQPRLSDKGQSEAEARRLRQAEALRANLLKRKTQSRARTVTAEAPEDTTGKV
ncbi:MAG: hypothetical protein K2Q10_12150 [Rhodospirillales bacterium]|nr:hypothetical protein [Rhodospirillales bacterium]